VLAKNLKYSYMLYLTCDVFDMAGEFGFTMNMLDIGGGFTGTEFQLEEVIMLSAL
jgi:hypothetical protein